MATTTATAMTETPTTATTVTMTIDSPEMNESQIITDVLSGNMTGSDTNMASTSGNNNTAFKCPLIPKAQDANDTSNQLAISISAPKLDYQPPPWALEPPADANYGFEVIKSGQIVEKFDLNQRKAATYSVIGRLESCDVRLINPTVSRYHCILQYGEDLMNRSGKGWFLYDLGSARGTKLNKRPVPAKQFIRIRVGHVLQFADSTRFLTLTGPPDDMEPEWEHSPTEMMRMKQQRKKLNEMSRKEQQKMEANLEQNKDEKDGIMWGMDFDEEMAYVQMNDSAVDSEEKYRDDPLRVLSRFFDKEGFEMEFKYEESGTAHNHKWTCSIELPVDTAAGQSLNASATCSGSRKEAQTMCALNACRVLDMHGVLFRSSNVARKKAKTLAENDYYDSDEDTYLDRTGQIEKSRENRRKRALGIRGEPVAEKETFESLTVKIASSTAEINRIESELSQLSNGTEKLLKSDVDDYLDTYFKEDEQATSESIEVKTKKSMLRQKLVQVKHMKERYEKLAKIAKPVELPILRIQPSQSGIGTSNQRSNALEISATTMRILMRARRQKAVSMAEHGALSLEPQPSNSESFIKDESRYDKPFVAEVEENESAIDLSAKVEQKGVESVNQLEPVKRMEPLKVTKSKEQLNSVQQIDTKKASPPPIYSETKSYGLVSDKVIDLSSKRRHTRIRNEASRNENAHEYGDADDYVTWMPPQNQKGDGTTALNAKFAGRY